MDDRAVIEQVLAGDNDAFGILVERYQTKIYNLALRMCHNEDDAFDLAQESSALLEHLPGLPAREKAPRGGLADDDGRRGRGKPA